MATVRTADDIIHDIYLSGDKEKVRTLAGELFDRVQDDGLDQRVARGFVRDVLGNLKKEGVKGWT